MARHPTIDMVCPFAEGQPVIQIDQDIAPTIRWMWANDVYTTESCQGELGGEAIIHFSSVDDMDRAAGLVLSSIVNLANGDPDRTILFHACRSVSHPPLVKPADRWRWRPTVYYDAVTWAVCLPHEHLSKLAKLAAAGASDAPDR